MSKANFELEQNWAGKQITDYKVMVDGQLAGDLQVRSNNIAVTVNVFDGADTEYFDTMDEANDFFNAAIANGVLAIQHKQVAEDGIVATDETSDMVATEPENVENGAVTKYVYTKNENVNASVTAYFNADGTVNVFYGDGSSDKLMNVTPASLRDQLQDENFVEAEI